MELDLIDRFQNLGIPADWRQNRFLPRDHSPLFKKKTPQTKTVNSRFA